MCVFMLQCLAACLLHVAARCSVSQCVAVCCSVRCLHASGAVCCILLQRVEGCCSVRQCGCSVLKCSVCRRVMQRVAACFSSVLQRVAACCSVRYLLFSGAFDCCCLLQCMWVYTHTSIHLPVYITSNSTVCVLSSCVLNFRRLCRFQNKDCV